MQFSHHALVSLLTASALGQDWQAQVDVAKAQASAAVNSAHSLASQYESQYGKRQTWQDSVAAAQASAAAAVSSADAVASKYKEQYVKRQTWQESVAAAKIEASKAVSSADALASQYESQYGKRQDWQDIVDSATAHASEVVDSANSVAATAADDYTAKASSAVDSANSIAATAADDYTGAASSIVASATDKASSVVAAATADASDAVSNAESVAASATSKYGNGSPEATSAQNQASSVVESATSRASDVVDSATSAGSDAQSSGTVAASSASVSQSGNAASQDVVPAMGVAAGALAAFMVTIASPRAAPDPSSTPIFSRSSPSYNTDNSSSARLEGGGSAPVQSQSTPNDFEEYELADYSGIQDRQQKALRDKLREAKRAKKLQKLDDEDEMKFSHSIQFNAVPDWSSHYIAYSNLKKLIYQLEKTIHRPSVETDAEQSPLIGVTPEDPDVIFQRALDVELEKISSFYQLKELEIFGEVSELMRDEELYEAENFENMEQVDGEGRPNTGRAMTDRPRQGSIFRNFVSKPRRASTISHSIDGGVEDSDDDDDENTALQRPKPPQSRSKSVPYLDGGRSNTGEDMRTSTEFSKSVRRMSQSYDDFAEQAFATLYSSGITLKKRTISLFVQLCELKSFIQLNKTGFTKVLKKYDKICDRSLKSKYVEKQVTPAYSFRPETIKRVEENIAEIEKVYAAIVTQGDIPLARKELRLHLREHVVWERNTVWREMIGIERKAQAANMGLRRTLLGADNDPAKARLQGDDYDISDLKEVSTPLGRYRCPSWLFSSTMMTLVGIIGVFFVLLFVPIMKKAEQQNCLAMLVFVSLLWATEVIPLFVTSLIIPFLSVILRVVRSDDKPHHRLDASAAAKYIFAAMWTPVIMLLLGGFTVAAALSKYDIAKRIATFVLSKAGTRPRTVLVTNMFVAAFASMWISNVAAPVLCFSIIQPMLRNLPSDSQMSKALILGIALASNIGGMLSPIASPQNIVALQIMSPQPSWGVWFFITIPVGIISILLIWIVLLISFQPGRGTTIVPIRPVKDKFSGVQWFISLVTLGTIVLWCVSHQLEWLFGDMGVVAIIPLVLFFGTGILTKEDFNNFLWTIIILAAGGLSLGKAVNSSGLLHAIANAITAKVEGMSLYGVLVVFASLILVVATFISHTVAALIILPLVASVGTAMDEPHPNLLVMGSALMCSAAMGLPTSGFPNMTAIMMEDSQTGQRYLQVKHFISRGIPSSVITLLVVISVGYGLMLVVGM